MSLDLVSSKHTSISLSQMKFLNTRTMLIGVHIRGGDFLIPSHVDMSYTVATQDYEKSSLVFSKQS